MLSKKQKVAKYFLGQTAGMVHIQSHSSFHLQRLLVTANVISHSIDYLVIVYIQYIITHSRSSENRE